MDPESDATDPEAVATDPSGQSEVGRIQRARATADRWKSKAEAAYADAAERRESSSAIDAAFRAVERDITSGGAVLAGALAFRLFMFMVPFVLACVLGLGVASDTQKKSPTELASNLGITGVIARTVSDAAKLSGFSRLLSLVVVLFALFLASRALYKVLRATHALVWDQVPRSRGNTTRGAIALIGLVLLALILVSALSFVRNHSGGLGFVLSIGFTVVPFVFWLLVSSKLPHAEGASWTHLWPGALLFAIGIELLHLFTVYWVVDEVSAKQERYGVLGVALALLLWAYLMGRIVILSAVVNQAVWSARHRDERAAPTVF